jgi:hypothetical protein
MCDVQHSDDPILSKVFATFLLLKRVSTQGLETKTQGGMPSFVSTRYETQCTVDTFMTCLFSPANVELKPVTIGEGVVAKRPLPAFQYIGHDPYLCKVEDKHGSEEIKTTADIIKLILSSCENKPERALTWLHEHHFTIERGKLLEGSQSLIQKLATEYQCETKAIERLWRIVYEYAMIGEPLGITTPKELRPILTILVSCILLFFRLYPT